MASNRHLGRIIVLQTLYEQEFRRASHDENFELADVLARNIARYEATVDDKAFIEQLVRGVTKDEEKLDVTLQPIAPEWPIDQIARMDRIVLRIGLYELQHGDVPPKVVINEAVELAKAFGSENSSKFVNGVLGTVLRQIEVAAGKVVEHSTDIVSKQKAEKTVTKESTEEIEKTATNTTKTKETIA